MSNEIILHEWVLDERGEVEIFNLGEYHDGPKCVRCNEYFCLSCEPEVFTQPCDNQDPALF